MTLRQTCEAYGKMLDGLVMHNGQPVDGALLLWAISGCESDHGRQREFARIEPAYSYGGVYYKNSTDLQREWQRWGALAACSYGSWQLMYPVAVEMGFSGCPCDLQNDEVSVMFVVRLIAERLVKRQGAKTLSDVLDSYNSGTHKDKSIPAVYIRKGIMLYEGGWNG